MEVLALFAFGITVGIPAGITYKSIGRVDGLVKLAIPRAVLAVASIVVFVDDGIVAVAVCQAAVAALFSIIGPALAAWLLHTGLHPIWAAARPAVVAGAVLGGCLALLDGALNNTCVTLAVAVPLGGATYVGTLWLVAPAALRKLAAMAFPDRAPFASDQKVAVAPSLTAPSRGAAARRARRGQQISFAGPEDAP
jgi:hypothetical protein